MSTTAEVISEYRHFLTRDLLYIVGGSCVILSFLHLFDRLPKPDLPIVWYVVGGGIAYVVGFALQDGFSLLGIVTTAPTKKLHKFFHPLYRRLFNKPWENLEDSQSSPPDMNKISSDRDFRALQRAVTLKHVGSTMASSGVVTAALLLVRTFREPNLFDGALATAAFVLSAVLWVLNWLHAAYQTQLSATLRQRHDTSGGRQILT